MKNKTQKTLPGSTLGIKYGREWEQLAAFSKAAVYGCHIEKMIRKKSQEDTCVGVSLLRKLRIHISSRNKYLLTYLHHVVSQNC